jgi:antitoxin HicB
MKYPAQITEDGGKFVVIFRDIPEAITQGDDEADAIDMATEVLELSMGVYFEEKRAVPLPSKPRKGERLIDLPTSVSAKVLLLNEMLAQNIAPSELARRMGLTRQDVNRLTDLGHTTKIDRIAHAFSAMGRELKLSVA